MYFVYKKKEKKRKEGSIELSRKKKGGRGGLCEKSSKFAATV